MMKWGKFFSAAYVACFLIQFSQAGTGVISCHECRDNGECITGPLYAPLFCNQNPGYNRKCAVYFPDNIADGFARTCFVSDIDIPSGCKHYTSGVQNAKLSGLFCFCEEDKCNKDLYDKTTGGPTGLPWPTKEPGENPGPGPGSNSPETSKAFIGAKPLPLMILTFLSFILLLIVF